LEGTSIGAATDNEGKYIIGNLSAGSYTLKISYIGYESKAIQIDLKENERIEENIQLETEAVATGEVFKQAGKYYSRLTIDKLQITSGIYFYTLRVRNSSPDKLGSEFYETKKMLLLK